MRKSVIALLLVLAMAAAANADVSYQPNVSGAKDAAGSLLANGTYLLVIDLNGDGWAGNSYLSQAPAGAGNSASWQWDPNDLVLDHGGIGPLGDPDNGPSNGGCYPNAYLFTPPTGTPAIPATYNAGVDHYYFMWFDKPYNVADAGPGVGTHYGVLDMGTVGGDPGSYTPDVTAGNATMTTISSSLANPYHNATLAVDVNNDGVVSPIDALLIINKLNAAGAHDLLAPGDPLPGSGGRYWDVTDDSTPHISPLDALDVINELNSLAGSSQSFGSEMSSFSWLDSMAGSSPSDLGGDLSSASVPEPASMLMPLAGGGLLALRRRNRARSAGNA